MHQLRAVWAIVAVLTVGDVARGGPDWTEAIDAGDTISNAGTPLGTGPIEHIVGTLGPGDLEDVFLIQIGGIVQFQAITEGMMGGPVTFDTRLWLFRFDGQGLLANENSPAGGMGSLIAIPATDGTGQIIAAPGRYFLAISGAGRSPVSSAGSMFTLPTNALTQISGPDGPGGAESISGWTGAGATGGYRIALTGASFPEVTWTETVDAGSLPSTAQAPAGGGPLLRIEGGLGGLEDMYLISIVDPAAFRARSDGSNGSFSDFNTQLFLFRLDGTGLLANDDSTGAPLPTGSLLTAAANDGSGAMVVTAGRYYLAITDFDNDPLSAGGAIFNQVMPSEVSGPDGVGGASPITAWTGAGPGGMYTLVLEGVDYASAVWVEPTDAASTTPVAQIPAGTGLSLRLAGQLAPGDLEDLFVVDIVDPLAFRARTDGLAGSFADFDTQLWLFRYSTLPNINGRGVLGNDDRAGMPLTTGSQLLPAATDPAMQTIPGAGRYYLAISGGPGRDPISSGGAIFNQATPTEISSPDGPGGGSPLVGWSGMGATGSYVIALEGTELPKVSFTESTDAGSTLATAVRPGGSGPLLRITGKLEATESGAGDQEDIYLIQIADPVNFTVRCDGEAGSFSDFDTQLFLFDVDGFGLLANDNTGFVGAAMPDGSWIFAPADDGTGQTITPSNCPMIPGPGCYYLAVTSADNDPVSAAGAIFNQVSLTEVSGPDGVGGAMPQTGWTGGGGTFGDYTLSFEGVSYPPPEPGCDPDLNAPIITMCAANPSPAPGTGMPCQAAVPNLIASVVAIDPFDCDLSLTITQSPAPGTLAGLGTTPIVLAAIDDAGNVATCMPVFTVVDNAPPAFTTCPANQLVPGAGQPCTAQVPNFLDGDAVAGDNCGAPVLTQSPPPGTVFAGMQAVTITATDGSGNIATCTFTVTASCAAPIPTVGEWGLIALSGLMLAAGAIVIRRRAPRTA